MTDNQKMRDAFEKIIVDLDLNAPIHAAWACFQAGAAWQAAQPVSDGVSGEGARTITTIVSKPCQYALKRLGSKAITEKRGHISWAVVHPGHAGFPTLFETKKQADEYRRNHASAYIVCRVLTIPLYGEIYAK